MGFKHTLSSAFQMAIKLHSILDVPTPPYSHYVGIIYYFTKEGGEYIMTVKDHNRLENHINTKLPGGSGKEEYEDDDSYFDVLLATLDKLGFEKKNMAVVYRNEKRRNNAFREEDGYNLMLLVLRTMVMECLEEVGYYPMDLQPQVVEFVEKREHTQYFIEVKELIDSNGERVVVPDGNFRSLNLDVKDTRVPLPIGNFGELIHSHKKATMRYLQHLGKPIIEEEKEEPQEEAPKIDPLEALLKRLGEEEKKD